MIKAERQKKVDAIEPAYVQLGERLRWLRHEARLSGKQLGERIGVHQPSVNSWERALGRVKVVDLVRIADAYGIEPAKFFTLLLSDLRIQDCGATEEVRAKRKAEYQKRAKRAAGAVRKKKRKKKGA